MRQRSLFQSAYNTIMSRRCRSLHASLPPSSGRTHPRCSPTHQLTACLLSLEQFAEIRDYNKHTRPLGVVPTAAAGEDDQEDVDDGDRPCLPSRRCRSAREALPLNPCRCSLCSRDKATAGQESTVALRGNCHSHLTMPLPAVTDMTDDMSGGSQSDQADDVEVNVTA